MDIAKPKKARRMSGMTLILILMLAAVGAGALTVASVYINGSSTKTATLIGFLTIYASRSDALSNTNSASYNVSLTAKNGVGVLTLVPIRGSSNLVPTHTFAVNNMVVSPYNVTMDIGGTNASLGWITTDTIWSALNASYATASGVANTSEWNDLNSSYAAASGPSAPANETIGHFSPTILQLPGSYYVFLGVTIPYQPQDTIPFAIGQVIAPGVPDRGPGVSTR